MSSWASPPPDAPYEMEMRPLKTLPEEGAAEMDSLSWNQVFYELARMDGEVGPEQEGGEPSINIRKLKQHFKSQTSYSVSINCHYS